MEAAGVTLQFEEDAVAPPLQRRAAFAGFSVEIVRMQAPAAFDYSWEGGRHYLALHDIVLRDGEIRIDGACAADRRDLRGRLTFAPQSSCVSGWSTLADGPHGYAAVFFDPGLAEAELERPLLGPQPVALLYFENRVLARTIDRLQTLVTAAEPADTLAAETLGLLAVLQLYPIRESVGSAGPGRLTIVQQRRLQEFIHAHLDEPLSLNTLAGIVGLSRYHFARCFTRTYGRGPHQHLRLRRIGLAATLLATSDLRIADIACRAGFGSPARLSTAFRHVTGFTPREFRRRAR
jgi:AraC family transcriptional regulator